MDLVGISMQTNIEGLVLGHPVLSAILTVVVLALVAKQATLTYPRYQTIHTVKTLVFRVVDPVTRKRGTLQGTVFERFFQTPVAGRALRWLDQLHGRPLINDKDNREDAEYLAAYDGTPRDVLTTLDADGWDLHLVSTDKRRPDGSLDDGHAVLYHDDGRQTEVYVFDAGHGMTHVYAHVETATTDPDGHLSDPQADGDPRGVVRQALDL